MHGTPPRYFFKPQSVVLSVWFVTDECMVPVGYFVVNLSLLMSWCYLSQLCVGRQHPWTNERKVRVCVCVRERVY